MLHAYGTFERYVYAIILPKLNLVCVCNSCLLAIVAMLYYSDTHGLQNHMHHSCYFQLAHSFAVHVDAIHSW